MFSPINLFQFHRKLIELMNAFLNARVLEYVALGGGRIPSSTGGKKRFLWKSFKFVIKV